MYIRIDTNQMASANAKIGVYCGRTALRKKGVLLRACSRVAGVNLPKRLGSRSNPNLTRRGLVLFRPGRTAASSHFLRRQLSALVCGNGKRRTRVVLVPVQSTRGSR